MKIYLPHASVSIPSYEVVLREAIDSVGHEAIRPWSGSPPTSVDGAELLIRDAIEKSDVILMPLFGYIGIPLSCDGEGTRWSGELEFDIAAQAVGLGTQRKLFLFFPQKGYQTHYPNPAEAVRWQELKERILKVFIPVKFQRPTDLKVKVLGCLIQSAGGVPNTVLISSTFHDLSLVRDSVRDAFSALRFNDSSIQAILDDRLVSIRRFEDGPPDGQSPLASSDALVRKSLLYFGILGSRYGTVVGDPNSNGRSLTHYEYDLACKLSKPRVFLLAPDECGLDPGEDRLESAENQQKLQEFKKAVRDNEERVTDLPMPPGTAGETIMLRTLDLISWLAQPARDEPARPPSRRGVRYVAHEYALLDKGRTIARATVRQTLEAWWRDSFDGRPRLMMITALGGMGKSASAWDWFSNLTDQTQPGPTHEMAMWWSFYASDSTVSAFAQCALAWLTESVVESTAADPAAALLSELRARPGQNVLFVLDGAERILRFYSENPDAARYEGVLLEQSVEEAAARASVSDQFQGDPAPLAAARRYLLSLRSEDAEFLLSLLAQPNVRILVTTRFAPTQFDELSLQANPSVIKYPLPGLTPEEVRFLWRDMGLVWESGNVIGCSGSLENICCQSLQGYALPITILGRIVLSRADAEGRFSRWKDLVESERDFDYCSIQFSDAPAQATGALGSRPAGAQDELSNLIGPKLLGAALPSRDPGKVACDHLTERIVSLAVQCLSSDEKGLLACIQESGVPILLATLLQDQVKPSGPFESASSLWRALNRLRDLKLVGRSKSSWAYEMHPLVRSAAVRLSAATAEDIEQVQKLEQVGQSFAAGSVDVGKDPSEYEIFGTILQLLRDHRIRRAAWMFVSHVEPVLRFYTDRSVTLVREQWLTKFDIDLSWIPQIVPAEADREEIHQLQLRVRALRMDNEILLGRITRGLNLAANANPGPPKPVVGVSSVFFALQRANLLVANMQLFDAERWLRFAYHAISGSPVPSADSSLPVWVCASLGHLWLMLGRLDWARWAKEECDRYVKSHPHADAEYLTVRIALEAGDADLDATLGGFQQAVEQSNLGYGRVSLNTLKAEIAQRSSDLFSATVAAETSNNLAQRGGFLRSIRKNRFLLALVWLEQGKHGEAAAAARAVAQDARAHGDTEIECQALLVEARGLHASGNTSEACCSASEALRCAWGEGEPYYWKSKYDEALALLSGWGCSIPSLQHRDHPPLSPVERLSPASEMAMSNTSLWTEEQVSRRLEEVKERLDWRQTTGSARKWWLAFESENPTKTKLILTLAEELAIRNATITEFFLAYVYSNTDNIQANLNYLDFTRRKKLVERTARGTGDHGGADDPTPNLIDWAKRQQRGLRVLSEDELTAFATFKASQLPTLIRAIIQPEDSDVARASFRTWLDLFPQIVQEAVAEALVGMKASAGEVARVRDQIKVDDPLALISYINFDRLKQEEARKKAAAAQPSAEDRLN